MFCTLLVLRFSTFTSLLTLFLTFSLSVISHPHPAADEGLHNANSTVGTPIVFSLNRLPSTQNVSYSATKRQATHLTRVGGGLSLTITLGTSRVSQHPVILDTGSAHTWVALRTFQCALISNPNQLVDPSHCALGSARYDGSFATIPGRYLREEFVSGELLSGSFGLQSVAIGQTRVTSAQVAYVHWLAYNGDSYTVGAFGLGAMGKAWTSANQEVIYEPVWQKLCTQRSLPKIFALAVQRVNYQVGAFEGDGGVLSLGGVPPSGAGLQYEQSWTDVPLTSNEGWGLKVGGISFQNGQGQETRFTGVDFNAYVDSGDSEIALPQQYIDHFINAFNPPAEWDESIPPYGQYRVECTAQFPKNFRINIAEKWFNIDVSGSLIEFIDVSGGDCRLNVRGIEDGQLPILGQPFLTEVVAVFDRDNSQMQFAARRY